MKVLVTGVSGFLGGAIARAFMERGDRVHGLSRRAPQKSGRDAIDLEHFQGDIADLEVCRRAAQGVGVVVHSAARVGAHGSPAPFERTNVEGTCNLLLCARDAGARAFVFTSTPSVVFDGRDQEGVDESVPYPRRHLSHYSRTKAIAEEMVLAANGKDMATVSLRPHLVFGPGDTSLLPRLLDRARSGRLRRFRGTTTKIDVTFVDDAAAAHLLAADALLEGGARAAKVAGKAFFISSGEPVDTWKMIDRLLEAAGAPRVSREISPRLSYFLGWLCEILWRGESEPPLTRWVVRELATSHWFDIGAARRDLGYRPSVSVEEGLRRLQAWLQTSDRRIEPHR